MNHSRSVFAYSHSATTGYPVIQSCSKNQMIRILDTLDSTYLWVSQQEERSNQPILRKLLTELSKDTSLFFCLVSCFMFLSSKN